MGSRRIGRPHRRLLRNRRCGCRRDLQSFGGRIHGGDLNHRLRRHFPFLAQRNPPSGTGGGLCGLVGIPLPIHSGRNPNRGRLRHVPDARERGAAMAVRLGDQPAAGGVTEDRRAGTLRLPHGQPGRRGLLGRGGFRRNGQGAMERSRRVCRCPGGSGGELRRGHFAAQKAVAVLGTGAPDGVVLDRGGGRIAGAVLGAFRSVLPDLLRHPLPLDHPHPFQVLAHDAPRPVGSLCLRTGGHRPGIIGLRQGTTGRLEGTVRHLEKDGRIGRG